MPKRRCARPREQHAGAWFAHVGTCQGQLETTTGCALKQGRDWRAARCAEAGLLPVYRAREQKAVNNFPFSSHDNKHCLQNVAEYFDLGMGRRKVEPERRQHNSQNFCLWAHTPIPSSRDGFTTYQTSFVGEQNPEGPFCRRYPRHHSEKWCP
ncbi:PREDICTED: testis-expressed sequence 36 protein, partial [Merops nubicus]|uniref:testis-expressed sequence 36 protein n=1 Tax=Merops nubicus TaxID=57421 RepID=UPI0004F0539E